MGVKEASAAYRVTLEPASADEAVPAGYKRTEVGVIPGDWNVLTIGSFCEITAGGDLIKANYAPTDDQQYPFPIYANALTNGGLYGYSTFFQYGPDCITVTARGDIGHAVYRTKKFCAIGRLLVISSRRSCDFRFVTEFINNFVEFAHESTGVPQLTTPQIAKYRVALPPTKAEQEAIAGALCDADALIESLQQLIFKKRQIKQGAMQSLLTGQQRLPGFSGEWKLKRIDALAKIYSGATPSTSRADFWNGDVPWCTPTDITALAGHKYLDRTSRTITQQGLESSSATFIPARSVVMTSRATIGECAINVVPVATNQGFKNLVPFDDVNVEFLYYLLLMQTQDFISLCGGSTFLEIGKTQLSAFEVEWPVTKEEQTAIATVLSDMDAEIAALEARLAKTRELKQGMMQALLTGRIRLPLDIAA